MNGIDNADRKILNMLQENANLTTKEIAAALSLTTTPVHERIKRLEREGLIKKYVALTDRKKLGKSMLAFSHVSLKEHSKEFLTKFESEITSFKEVIACYHVAGNYDYMIKVVVEDMDAYQDFIVNKLASMENIGNVHSSFVLNEIKFTTAIAL